jgi:hypothetical protein
LSSSGIASVAVDDHLQIRGGTLDLSGIVAVELLQCVFKEFEVLFVHRFAPPFAAVSLYGID